MPDLIADFIERLLAKDPNLSIRTADELKYELRVTWGGQRVYISRNPGGDTTDTGLRVGAIDPSRLSRRTRRRYL
jgi:hypothetical protein